MNGLTRFLRRLFGRLDVRGPGDPNPENDLARRAMFPDEDAELEARRAARQRALSRLNDPKKP